MTEPITDISELAGQDDGDFGPFLDALSEVRGRMTTGARPNIVFTYDGAIKVECFEDDPDAEHGQLVCFVDAGGSFWDVAAKVDAHITEHGC